MNKLEESYTSTTTKLLQHLDRLQEIKKGVWLPITLQLAPTDTCNLNCVFCSVKNRAGDEIPWEDLKEVLQKFIFLGVRGCEITGGGEPTLYPHIEDTIRFLLSWNIDIGLITNGVELMNKIEFKLLEKLAWIRISLNALDYGVPVQIPKLPNVNFSYVWNELSTPDIIPRLDEIAKTYDVAFLRIVPDCLSKEAIERAKVELPPLVKPYKRLFAQTKSYDKPKRCWFGYLKPFLAPDGYIYHCSANPLIERKFHPAFRLCHMKDDLFEVWKNPEPFDTRVCGLCFFKEQNELIEQILTEVEHKSFV